MSISREKSCAGLGLGYGIADSEKIPRQVLLEAWNFAFENLLTVY